ncbi:hypothetical protein PPNSA23_16860 [Phyllobacterium phragmitis]|uniref:Uncharacterized protein n=1 Tax=Phyllobacterium phragmitis TaxID=2670329 RepID=A0ABQ0GYM8_9HYPH
MGSNPAAPTIFSLKIQCLATPLNRGCNGIEGNETEPKSRNERQKSRNNPGISRTVSRLTSAASKEKTPTGKESGRGFVTRDDKEGAKRHARASLPVMFT